MRKIGVFWIFTDRRGKQENPKSDTAIINREIPSDLSGDVGLLQQAVLCPLLQQGGRRDFLLLLKRASARLPGNRFAPGPPKKSPAEAGF